MSSPSGGLYGRSMRVAPFALLLSVFGCDRGEASPTPVDAGGRDTGPPSEDASIDASVCPETTGDEGPEVLPCRAFADGPVTLVDHLDRLVDYRIECRAQVSHPLTIEAGVVIELAESAELATEGGGSITAIGDECGLVRFVGAEPRAGFWRGITLADDSGDTSFFERVEIRHTGSNDHDAALLLRTQRNAAVVRQSVLADGSSYGISARGPGQLLTIERTTITGFAEGPILAHPTVAGRLPASLDLVGNERDFVFVVTSSLDAPTRWIDVGVPFRLTQVSPSGPALTLEVGGRLELGSGVTVLAEEDRSIDSVGGSLVVEGTAAAPVTLASVAGTPAGWRGLSLDARGEDATFELRHVSVADGGGGDRTANITLRSDSVLRLEEVESTGCDGHGLEARGGTLEVLGPITLTGNAGAPARVGIDVASGLSGAGTYFGNDVDAVVVDVDGLTGTHRWEALDVPYRLVPQTFAAQTVLIGAGASLTLEAGAIVELDRAEDDEWISGFQVQEGSFAIEGTSDAPVTLRGATPTPGFWRGVFFRGTDPAGTLLGTFSVAHARVQHAGGGAFNSNGDLGAFVLTTNCEVRDTEFSELPEGICAMTTGAITVAGSGNTVLGDNPLLCEAP